MMEIFSRPQPRASTRGETGTRPGIAALVMAAGRSSRMGGPNKLLANFRGKPLVRHVVEAALASNAVSVTVVTGYQADAVEYALAGLDVRFAHNPNYAEGLSTSVRVGVSSLSEACDAVLIALGDMPLVNAALLDLLMAAYDPDRAAQIVLPVADRQRGNPVIWARHFFADLERLQGDAGARQILKANADTIVEVTIDSIAISTDVDTQQALAALNDLPDAPAPRSTLRD